MLSIPALRLFEKFHFICTCTMELNRSVLSNWIATSPVKLHSLLHNIYIKRVHNKLKDMT